MSFLQLTVFSAVFRNLLISKDISLLVLLYGWLFWHFCHFGARFLHLPNYSIWLCFLANCFALVLVGCMNPKAPPSLCPPFCIYYAGWFYFALETIVVISFDATCTCDVFNWWRLHHIKCNLHRDLLVSL